MELNFLYKKRAPRYDLRCSRASNLEQMPLHRRVTTFSKYDTAANIIFCRRDAPPARTIESTYSAGFLKHFCLRLIPCHSRIDWSFSTLPTADTASVARMMRAHQSRMKPHGLT